jgi:hypothetical protein
MSDVSKLPKWAQEKIADLEREKESAIKALKRYLDDQTESPIYVPDHLCLGDGGCGPSHVVRYIQGNKIAVKFGGVELDMLLSEAGNQRDCGIHLTFNALSSYSPIALLPRASNSISLVAKENMR